MTRSLRVILGIALFGIGVVFFFYIIPLAASHSSLSDRNAFDFEPHIGMICGLAMIILGLVGFLITIMIPFILVITGLAGEKK